MPAAPTPDPVIRDATEADLPRLVELMAQLSLDAQREDISDPLPGSYLEAFRAVDADPRQRLLVAEREGRLAGSLVLIIVPNVSREGKPWAAVENVVVDESERGRGLGERLMRYAIAEARRAGCYKLSLTSNRGRTDAHRFYERLGFEATHQGFRIQFDL